MANLNQALEQLSIVLGTVDGVRRTYPEAPETLNDFPCFVIYTQTGTQSLFPEADTPMGKATRQHSVKAILYLGTEEHFEFSEIEKRARPFIEPVFDKLLENMSLNGTIETFMSNMSYSFGTSPVGGIRYWTIMFEIPFRLRTAVTIRK